MAAAEVTLNVLETGGRLGGGSSVRRIGYIGTFMPFSLIFLHTSATLSTGSIWNVYWLTPASAIGTIHCNIKKGNLAIMFDEFKITL